MAGRARDAIFIDRSRYVPLRSKTKRLMMRQLLAEVGWQVVVVMFYEPRSVVMT
jgi:hypothetical protein